MAIQVQVATSNSRADGLVPNGSVLLIARFCNTFAQLAAAILPITSKLMINQDKEIGSSGVSKHGIHIA